MSATTVNSANRAILTWAIGTGGTLKDATLHLFTNNVVPSGQSVKTDFTEATFDGYTATGAIAWGAPYTAADGLEHTVGPTSQFTCTGPTVAETIIGYYILSVASGTPLLMAERFPAGVPVAVAGDAVFATPDYQLGK